MKNSHLAKNVAAFAVVLPLLTGCNRPPVDTSLQDNSSIRQEARQQEIQRQMEEAQRAQQAVPQMSFPR
jgi:hypothetical protein